MIQNSIVWDDIQLAKDYGYNNVKVTLTSFRVKFHVSFLSFVSPALGSKQCTMLAFAVIAFGAPVSQNVTAERWSIFRPQFSAFGQVVPPADWRQGD